MFSNYSIILVRPQLSSNIGSVARVMLNFSIKDLRIVSPTEDWNNDKAKATATGAFQLLDNATVYNRVEDAAKDLNLLFALTARSRFINKPMLSISEINLNYINEINKVGLMFGPENSGLSNEDLVLADKLFNIPTNPKFSSLNLAQAVGITLFQLSSKSTSFKTNPKSSQMATKDDLNQFFEHLHQALKPTHFFQEKDKETNMLRNIKNIFSRIENLSTQEIRTLRGIITELSKKKLS